MKQVALFLTFILTTTLFAQTGDITFFSHTGKKFYVIINGVKQNAVPETNVKIQGLQANWYACKIIGENNEFQTDKNIIVKMDTLITYNLAYKKNDYKIKFHSEIPLQSSIVDQSQFVVDYHTTEIPVESNTTVTTVETVTTTTETTGTGTSGVNMDVNVNESGTQTGVNTGVVVNETGIGTNTTTGNESININISVSEGGMSTDISTTGTGTGESNVTGSDLGHGTAYEETTTTVYTNGSGTGTTYSETTTVTTTTTTTSSSSTGSGTYGTTSGTQITENTTYNGTNDASMYNCVVDQDGMKKVTTAIENESFSDDQLRVAKQFAKNKCLTVDQVKHIAVLFDFSEPKMDFVKVAYDNCINKSDYYELMEVFDFSGEKEELEKFLDSK